MSRKRGPVETPEYARMVARLLRAHGRRVADADPEDLADLVALRAVLDEAIADAVAGQRARHGRSWADLARVLGVTRQAVHLRYGRPSEVPATLAAHE